MIIKLGREHRVNTGNYEHIIVSGSIELDTKDFAGVNDAHEDFTPIINQQLDDLLAVDLAAAEAAVPEDSETHLQYWKGK